MQMTDSVEIISFEPRYKADFKRINIEWIEKYFKVEPQDLVQLDQPEKIIFGGGQIFLAKLGNEIVGVAALIHEGHNRYELAKMGVTEKAKGLGIGKKLCQVCIDEAQKRNATYLSLVSNKSLTSAINIYLQLGFVEIPLGETLFDRGNIRMEYHG
jgi:putative acetyltransferase